MRNPAVESIPTSLTHEDLHIIASNGILALPIVSAEKEMTMPVSTGYPLSSVSLKHAKEVISSLGNTISIVPLKETIPSIKAADGTLTKPCGTLNVPITFANKRTFQFQMLVVPALTCDLIFGNNHLVKTDAVINHSKRSISFNHYNLDPWFVHLSEKKKVPFFFYVEGVDCSRTVHNHCNANLC